MKSEGLIIFIKNPVLGKVKTRLAKSIGDVKALQVYQNLLSHTREVCLQVDINKYLFYDQEVSSDDEWESTDFIKKVQSKGNLGDRIKGAFEQVLIQEKKAIIIGSDCPEISPEIIDDAFHKLDFADIVIGPTLDGGYYLLGMKENHSTLFEDIDWSTSEVFSQTRQRIVKAGLLFTCLEKLSDLDNIEDLKRYLGS